MKHLLALTTVAGLATAANAHTTINFEASTDGSTWVRNLVFETYRQTVYVRMRVQLTGATALGFAGMTCQPVLTNWGASDVRNGFTFPGLGNDGTPGTETTYDGKMVSSTPGTNTGRLFPFGPSNQGASSSSGLLTSFNDSGNRLRFAGSKNTTETTNAAWGVVSSQSPASVMGSNFSSATDVVLFRYSVTMQTVGDHFASLVQLSGGAVKWYLDASGGSVLSDTDVTINAGFINSDPVGPAPGALALLGFSAAAAGRRRRRN